jgi:hypothetical protein
MEVSLIQSDFRKMLVSHSQYVRYQGSLLPAEARSDNRARNCPTLRHSSNAKPAFASVYFCLSVDVVDVVCEVDNTPMNGISSSATPASNEDDCRVCWFLLSLYMVFTLR